MAEAVYILCALTSVTCAVLLLRGYLKSRTRLLFWGACCFVGLGINNVLLFVDLAVPGTPDLSILRGVIALVAMGTLLFGLVWDSK